MATIVSPLNLLKLFQVVFAQNRVLFSQEFCGETLTFNLSPLKRSVIHKMDAT